MERIRRQRRSLPIGSTAVVRLPLRPLPLILSSLLCAVVAHAAPTAVTPLDPAQSGGVRPDRRDEPSEPRYGGRVSQDIQFAPSEGGGAAEREETRSSIVPDLVGSASGAEARDFFGHGSARTIFSPEAELTDQPGLHILNASRGEPAPLEEPQDPEQLTPELLAKIDPERRKALLASLPREQRFEVEYGRPDEDDPILAQENAPKPFKAMMAAMAEKDDRLAYKYARKYARYLRNVKEQTLKVMTLNKYAMRREGLAPGSDLREEQETAPDYTGIRYLYEEEKAAEAAVQKHIAADESAYATRLDPETEALLVRARADEDAGVERSRYNGKPLDEVQKPIDEKTERATVRYELAARIPRDPKGMAAVYWFFRPQDGEARRMVPEVQALFDKTKGGGKVEVVGLTIDFQIKEDFVNFARQTKATFPLRMGREVARRTKVNSSPTLMFVAPSTGEIFLEEGVRSFWHMDEVVKVMLGL